MNDEEIKVPLRQVIDWLDAKMNAEPSVELANTSNYLEEEYQRIEGKS